MRTREEFVKKWRVWMVGLAMEGHVSTEKEGSLRRAEKLMNLPEEMQRILEAMYDYLNTEDKKK